MTLKATKAICFAVLIFTGLLTVQDSKGQITVDDTVVCQNLRFSLKADTSALYVEHTWAPSSAIQGSDSGAVVIGRASDTTVYSLFSLDTNGVTDTFNITIYTLPAPDVSVTYDDSLCYGDTSVIELSGADDYMWVTGNQNYLSGSNTDSIRVFSADSIATGGNNNYTVSGYNGICYDTLNFRVYVSPSNPTIDIIEHQADICYMTEGYTEIDGSTSYQWSDPNGILDVTTGDIVRPTSTDTTSPQTYSVVGTSGICSSAPVEFTINGLPIPELNVTQSSGGNPLCRFGLDTLTISSSSNEFQLKSKTFVKYTDKTIHPFSVTSNEDVNVKAFGTNGCFNEQIVSLQLDPSCTDSTVFFLSAEELKALDREFVKVYQAGNALQIESDLNLNGREFRLLDLTGKAVKTERLSGSKINTINAENLTRGIYIYQIIDGSGLIGAGKVPVMTR